MATRGGWFVRAWSPYRPLRPAPRLARQTPSSSTQESHSEPSAWYVVPFTVSVHTRFLSPQSAGTWTPKTKLCRRG